MAKNNRVEDKVVRLANGAVELEKYVGAAMVALRQLESYDPTLFQKFVGWIFSGAELTEADVLRLRDKYHLVDDSAPPSVFDDVRDVLDSVLVRRGKSSYLGISPLSEDQSGI